MSELYAKLLDATTLLTSGEVIRAARVNGPIAASRAVVELHKPESGPFDTWCAECSDVLAEPPGFHPWPCSTITAIAEALGVTG